MKVGHHSEDAYVGYDVCNYAILGNEKTILKLMPSVQKNLCVNGSAWDSLKPMENLWIPWESHRIPKLRLLAAFIKSRVPSAGEY